MRLLIGIRTVSLPVMIVAIGLLACKKKTTKAATESVGPAPAPAATKAPLVLPETPKETMKLNQAAKLDGVTLTVEEFKDCRVTNLYSRRAMTKKKEKLVGISVLFEGNGEKDHQVSYSNFKVSDPEGLTFRSTLYSGSDCSPTLKSGRVGSGEKTRGWVLFQIPATAKSVNVVFTNQRPHRLGTPTSEREQKANFDPR
jgi:hypothetical protein